MHNLSVHSLRRHSWVLLLPVWVKEENATLLSLIRFFSRPSSPLDYYPVCVAGVVSCINSPFSQRCGFGKCFKILDFDTSIIWDIRELEGNKIISASDDNTSKVWDLNSQKELFNLCTSHRHISGVALVNKKKVVLASGRNLLLYNLETKQQESCLDITVWTLKELSNGDIACGLGNGLLYIIKVTDELIIKTKFARGHKTSINCIIELENHKIVTSSDENDLILWNPNDPESMYFIKGHTKIITSLCFISGTKFATASRDKTLKIWE